MVLVPVCCVFAGGVVGPEVAQEAEDWPGSDSQTFHPSPGRIPSLTPVSTRQSLRSEVYIEYINTHISQLFLNNIYYIHLHQNVCLTIALLLLLFLEDY